MKRLLALSILAATLAHGAPDTSTTNWFTNATIVANGAAWTNALGGPAIVFDVAELDTLTADQATSNAFAVVHHLLVYLHDRWEATAATNRPSTTTMNESSTFSAGATNTITIYTGFGQTRTLTLDEVQ